MSDFSCAICLGQAEEPVVTRCGHLFCWECLDQWLSRPGVEECPVCKGRVRRDETGDIIPLYGKGRRSDGDTRPSAPAEAPKPSAPHADAAAPPPQEGAAEHHARPRAPRAPTPPPRARNGFQHVRNRLPIFSGVLFLGFTKEFLVFYAIALAAYAVPWQQVWLWLQARLPAHFFANAQPQQEGHPPQPQPQPQDAQQAQREERAAQEERQQARAAQADRDQTADAIRRRLGLDAQYVDYIVGCALIFSVIAWYVVMSL